MASLKIERDYLDIEFSLLDQLLAFHGSFRIPFGHVTNAYVSNIEDLQLQYRLQGRNLGFLKTAGIFASPSGLIFCDVTGHGDCLVVETLGERFPRIAVELTAGNDPNALAHEICRRVPDGGAVE